MGWDEHASTWDEDPAARAYSRAAFDSLHAEAARRDVTISGARVCDFGCGTGLLTEQLAADATHIDAVDASPAMLDVLREKVARNGWTHVDTLGEPRGAGGHYDLIVCSSVCAFLDDYPGTVRHLASLLRPDGLFVQWDWELDPEDAEEYGLSRDEIRDALVGAGLRSVRVDTAFRIPMGGATMAPLLEAGGDERDPPVRRTPRRPMIASGMHTTERRTKILATVGPASDSEPVLRGMIEAGMDAVRLNLSHGTLEEALTVHQRIRALAAELDRPVGTLVDLPGPKIRAASFGRDGVNLQDGQRVRLEPGQEGSTGEVIQVDYPDLLGGIEVGDRISFGDGGIDLEVTDAPGDRLEAVVSHGGSLTGRPGVHVPSERLSISTPTKEDLRILDAFVEAGVDMVALSFVRSAHDLRRLGTEPYPRGPLVVAKIETRAAVDNLAAIVEAAGAVMIARGDLGIECSIEELPHLQKHIIRECIAGGRPAITATQMLESMVRTATPTRAEASDVANAVFDGSSAVMLSGETATGNDPVNVVATMARLCARADENFDVEGWTRLVSGLRSGAPNGADDQDLRITDTMTDAAWRVAREVDASAIVCLTRTGFTVRAVARYRPRTPILGFTPDERVRRQLSISWGAMPMPLSGFADTEEMVREALETARAEGHVRNGDVVVVLAGVGRGSRTTDVLRVIQIA